ncbi:MAG: hypothetical protein HY363_05495 [Candidatus Aenigmarchaeota archaeon]|nr:hypothetical protein [Candidatus Aenigmarchaeota archaeon]
MRDEALFKLYAFELEALAKLYELRFSAHADGVEKYLNEERICVWKAKMRDVRAHIRQHSDHKPSTQLDFLVQSSARCYPPSTPVPPKNDPLWTAYKVLIKIATIKKQYEKPKEYM